MRKLISNKISRATLTLTQSMMVFLLACFFFSSVEAQPTIATISDVTVNEGSSQDFIGLIDVATTGTLSSVVITSVSNEAETLNSTNAGKQADPFPKTADGFITENIVLSDANNYQADITILAPFGAGGMDASGTGSYTVTVTATDGVGSVIETFNIIVNAVHQPISASGTTLIEAESFYNQGPTNTGSGNNGIGVEIDPLGFTNIGFTSNNDFVEYLINAPQDGAYELDIRLAKGTGSTEYTFEINGLQVFENLPSTGGWTTYISQKATVFLSAGLQVLRFEWKGTGNFYFNIDDFTVQLLPNQAPVLDAIADQTNANSDVVSGLSAVANDVENDGITYSDGGTLPTGLSINSTTGEISGTIDAGASASSPFSVTITATDDGTPSEAGTTSFIWNVVTAIDNPPTIDPVSDIEIAEGGTATANIQVNDDTDPSATIEIYDISNGSGNPSYGTAISSGDYTFTDNGSGSYTLNWITSSGDAKAYQAVVTANDGVNPDVIEIFDIDVAAPIPGLIEANTFSNPLPWYGSSQPGAGYSVAIETTPVQNIGYIDNGDFVDYAINVPAAGVYGVTILAGKGNGGITTCTLSEDNGGFTSIGSVPIVQTGWQTYASYSTLVEFTNAGIQMLRMSFNGGANIDKLTFSNVYDIAASVGSNGSISPVGNVQVIEGDDATFDITPDPGFEIDVLTVDGNVVSNTTQYTFSSVATNHTIDVTFKPLGTTYTIIATAGPNGSISPDGSTIVAENGSQSYSITPDYGFRIADVLVDGVSVGMVSSYDFTNVTANATIEASFEFDGIYVNVGGPAYTSIGGTEFVADFGATVGTVFPSNAGQISTLAGTDFSNTSDDELFRTERYGDYTYSFDVPDGNYIVDLYVAEIFQGILNATSNAVPGKRIFDILIEGNVVLDNFDALNPATGGAFAPATALIKSFLVNVIDGTLDITTFTEVDNAKLSAICIRPDNGSVNTPPTITAVSPISAIEGQTILETITATDSDGISEFQIKIVAGAIEVPSAQYTLTQNGNTADLSWSTMVGDAGTYTATVLAFDGQDVSSSTFSITIAANQPPVITLVGDNPTFVELGGTYSEEGATATDPEEGVISPVIIGGDVVNTAVLGDYLVTYNINDGLGLAAAEVIRTVSVTNPADTEKPVITVLGDNPLNIIVGSTFTDPGASATDNVDDDATLTANIVVGGDVVDVNTVGPYIITYNVTDAANNPADEKTRTVNVIPIPEPGCANASGGYRVNAGGPSGFGENGIFEEDQTVTGAGGSAANGTPSPYYVSAGDNTFGSTAAVTNLTGYPDEIFQTERWLDGDQKWEFPANGTYDINLLFNEGWTGEAANPRVFDVIVEGNVVLDDFRPSVAAGGVNIAIVETISGIVVTDGILNIDLIQGTQNPAIKGIDICFISGPANTAPMVSISAPVDGTSADEGTIVTFIGSVTDVDEDDTALTDLLSWSSSIDGIIGAGATFDVNNLSVGTHTITASVTDAGGLSDDSSISFEITIPNAPPSLTIDAPITGSTITRGTQFTVSGTATDAEEGDISTSISWTSSDAQTTYIPTNGIGSSVDLVLVEPGTTTIFANVSDGDGAPATQQQITVDVPAPQVAFASPSENEILNSLTVTVDLNAANMLPNNTEYFHFYINEDENNLDYAKRISIAASNGATSYVFDETSGNLAADGNGNGIVEGSNTIVVVAADENNTEFTNAQAKALVTFTVTLGQPDANFTISQNPAICGTEVTFDGSSSSHTGVGLSIVSYEWDLDYDGITFDVDRTGSSFSETFTAFQGPTDVALRVTDDAAPTPNTSIEIISFSVENQDPVSVPGGPYVITIGDDLTLDGSGSSDPDACGDAIASYEWDLNGDDSFDDASGANPTLLATDLTTLGLSVGVYDVKLRVTDGQGASIVAQTTLTINDIPNSVPSFTAIPDITINEGEVLNIASLISISDTDGDDLTVSVTSVSNEPQLLQTTNTGAQADPFPINAEGFYALSNVTDLPGSYTADFDLSPIFGDGGGANGDGNGIYTITVQVEDEDLNIVTEEFTVTVNDVDQVIASDAVTKIEAESFDNQGPANTLPGSTTDTKGIGVEINDPGVTNIGFTSAGDFAEYFIDVAAAGFYDITFQVGKNSGAEATMNINQGAASIAVTPTGGWQTYIEVTTQLLLPAGPQVLRFDWAGSGFLFNIDYFEFTPVLDETPPVISLIGDNPLMLEVGVPYTELGATATDNVDGDISGAIVINATNVDVNTVGTYQVTYDVSDAAGNAATQVIRDVMVSPPNTAPTVTIASPLDNSSEVINTLLTFTGSVSDAEEDDLTLTNALEWTSDLDGIIGTGGTFDYSLLTIGSHVITASVTDVGGLVGQASITITITNTDTPPVLTIDSPLDGSAVSRGTAFTLTATATDTEDGLISNSISWSTDDAEASLLPVNGIGSSIDMLLVRPGATIVTASITDVDNNTVTASITVNVSAPEISLVQPLEGATLNSRTVTFEIAPIDMIPDNAEHYHFYLNPTDINNIDEQTRISTASDPFQNTFVFDENSGSLALNGSGNGIIAGSNTVVIFAANQFHEQFQNVEASVTVNFDVVDNTPPVITLQGDNPLQLQLGNPYIDPGFTAFDDFDGDITGIVVVDDNALDVNTEGTYVITYNVLDAEGNPATEVTRTVIVSALGGIPQVFFEITPGTGIGGSTYGSTDNFQITNQSTGNVRITKFTIDLSTAILPDMVFDPVGAGGDATAQCFTPDLTKATTVGLVNPANPCVDPFLAPREGGYDIITLDFTDFNPAENFSFAVDIDPNSIQGVPGAGFAGAVSGLELAGATITVEFENGFTIVSNLYEDGSFGGSQVVGPTNLPAPTLQASGTVTNPSTAYNASQEIIICGEPNGYYSLLQIDARLHIESGEPPYNVSDPTFYANELVDKVVYNGQFDSEGKVTITVPLLLTPGTDGDPDGGLNYFMAVQSDQPYAVNTAVSATSDPILLLYDDDPVLSDLTGTVIITNALSQAFDATVALYQGSNLINSYQVSTNANGEFLIPGILPGTYDFWVKNSKTLAVLVNGSLTPGANAIDFGAMVSGDYQNDNDIDIIDFSGYANSFGFAQGDAEYDSQADFNFDNVANILDFSMFANGYGLSGAAAPSGSGQLKTSENPFVKLSEAEFDIVLSNSSPAIDEIFEVFIDFEQLNSVAGSSQFHLLYDRELMDLIDITIDDSISNSISNMIDGENGVITFEITQDFSKNKVKDMLSISFRKNKSSATTVTLVSNGVFNTKSINTKTK